MEKTGYTLRDYRNKKEDQEWEPLIYVDASPDDDYVLRILRAHLDNTNGRFVCDPPNPVFDFMNECQEKRAKLLEAAIEKLTA